MAGAAACGGETTAPLTSGDVAGTYALVSVDGRRLPAPFGMGTAVLYDTIALARDSTFRERQGAGTLGSAVVTDSGAYAGRWALDAAGGRVMLTTVFVKGPPTTLTFALVGRGAGLTIDLPKGAEPGGGLWVYNRVR